MRIWAQALAVEMEERAESRPCLIFLLGLWGRSGGLLSHLGT